MIENVLSNEQNSCKSLIEDPLIQKIVNLPDKLLNLYANNLK